MKKIASESCGKRKFLASLFEIKDENLSTKGKFYS
jgi:hypothetical protein